MRGFLLVTGEGSLPGTLIPLRESYDLNWLDALEAYAVAKPLNVALLVLFNVI